MKTEISFTWGKSYKLKLMILVLSFHFITPVTDAQLIEVDGGIGYSIVNLDNYTYWDDGTPYSWSKISGYLTAQGFYNVNKTLSLGASIGFQHLFKYTMKVYYGLYDTEDYFNYTVNIVRLTALARVNSGDNFIDLGIGIGRIEEVTELVTGVGFGHTFKLPDKLFGSESNLSDRIAIPVKVNFNLIL